MRRRYRGRRCRRPVGTSAGGTGFRPYQVRWSVLRWPLRMCAGHTSGRCCRRPVGDERRRYRGRRCRRPVGTSAGGTGFRPYQVRWSVFRWRRGTSPSPTLGRRRCRRRYIRTAVGVSLAVGDVRRRYRVPALHLWWSVFRWRRGTSPSPTLGRRRCRRRYIGTAVIVSLAVGDGRRRYRVPALHLWWSVFRRRRGTSPSPTLGRRRCRRRVGISAGGTLGRWSVFRWWVGMGAGGAGGGVATGRLGMSAGGTLGRWSVFRWRLGMCAGVTGFRPSTSGGRCSAGGGGQAPALQGAALPPAVHGVRVGVTGAICFRTIVW